MARSKKTRKIGQIGVRKAPKDQRSPNRSATKAVDTGKSKKHKGNPSGSRHSQKQQSDTSTGPQNRDPRLGSKKPVPLVVTPVQDKPKKPTYFSPAQELKAIENDRRLDGLIEKLDEGGKISPEDQAYVDEKLARHQTLCAILGIETQAPQEKQDDDPLARLDAIDPKELL